jgi:hypothetical protein
MSEIHIPVPELQINFSKILKELREKYLQEASAVIPVLEGTLEPGITVLACAVRAGDREPVERENIPSDWLQYHH